MTTVVLTYHRKQTRMSAIDVKVVVTAVIRGPSVGVSSGAPYVQPMALEGVGWALGGLERIREDLPTLLQSKGGPGQPHC